MTERSDVCALFGPSKAGKTSFLRRLSNGSAYESLRAKVNAAIQTSKSSFHDHYRLLPNSELLSAFEEPSSDLHMSHGVIPLLSHSR
jgi:hypothetical protein